MIKEYSVNFNNGIMEFNIHECPKLMKQYYDTSGERILLETMIYIFEEEIKQYEEKVL